MRRIFTTSNSGKSRSSLEWGERSGKWQRISKGVYIEGFEPPTPLERAISVAIATEGVVSGTAAAILHQLDGVELVPPFATLPNGAKARRPHVRRSDLPCNLVTDIEGYKCTNGFRTLLDIAAVVNERVWEQALECALRKKFCTIDDIVTALPEMSAARRKGVTIIRNVLSMRPDGAPPTGSLLETLFVQLIRDHTSLPDPQRQVEILSKHGTFIAYVDFAWPDAGLFVECYGRQHVDQLTYDTRRESSVVASTGWLIGRVDWPQVTRIPRPTAQRVVELYEQALPLQQFRSAQRT